MSYRSVRHVAFLVIAALVTSCSGGSAGPSNSAAAPGGSSSGGEPVEGGTLTIAYPQDPYSLNPTHDGGQQGKVISTMIRERMVEFDREGKIVPAAATSWDNPDPLTYVFHLRPGMKFSDGTPVTAEDVKYSWDRVLQDDSQPAGTYSPYIDSVTAVDESTVQLQLKIPFLDLLPLMASEDTLGIMPDGWLESCGSDCETTTVGSGPFMVKEWVKGDHLTLAKNPYYWDAPRPYLDEVVFKVVPDAQASVLNLQNGAVDVLYTVPLNDVETLKGSPGISVYQHGSGLLTEVALNTAAPPFDDLKVRQALSLALDRQAIVDSALFGYGEVPVGTFPSWHEFHDSTLEPPEYDPDRAKELLSEAGFGPDNPLQFVLRTTSEAFTPDEALIIQSQLAEIGVEAQIEEVEKSAFYGSIFRGEGIDYTAWQAGMAVYFFGSVATSYAYDQWDKLNFINSTGVNLEGGYQDEELQALLDQARGETDPDTLKQRFHDIQARVAEDALYLFIGFQDNLQATTDRVHDFDALTQQEYPLKYVWVLDE